MTARTQAGHEVSEDILLPLDDPTLTIYQMALDYHTPIDESVVIAVGQLLYQTGGFCLTPQKGKLWRFRLI